MADTLLKKLHAMHVHISFLFISQSFFISKTRNYFCSFEKMTLSQSNIVTKLKKHKKIHQTIANKLLCDYKRNVLGRLTENRTSQSFQHKLKAKNKKTKKKKNKQKDITLFSKQFRRIPPKHKQI